MTVRLGYNTNGFPHHRLLDVLDILHETGYRAAGLTLDVHHAPPGATDYARLGAELRARDLLPVVETGARFLLDPRRKHRPSLLTPGPERRRRLDFYFACLEAAAALEAPAVALWSGREEGGDPWRLLVSGLEEVCDRAAELGLTVAFEPEPGMFVETLAQFEELRRKLPHPALKLTLDVGHLQCVETEPPARLVARWAPLLANVHLDDHRRGVHEHLFFGEGEVDFPAVLGALEEAGRGRELPATVELSRHGHDAVETARRAFRRLTAWRESLPPASASRPEGRTS